jgi:hypothetical protein
MKKWLIEIRGHTHDLEILDNNQQPPLWSIVKKTEGGKVVYYLESSRFDTLDDSKDVEKACRELILEINGVAKLRRDDFEPIEFHGVAQLDKNEQPNKFLHTPAIPSTARLHRPTLIGGDRTAEELESPDVLAPTHSLVESDKDVKDAIRIYSKSELGWKDLSDIYEIMEHTGELEKVRKKLNIPVGELKRFTHTCQHPEAIGEEARHPRPKSEPPKNPMELGEAVHLIKRLLTEWIDSREN